MIRRAGRGAIAVLLAVGAVAGAAVVSTGTAAAAEYTCRQSGSTELCRISAGREVVREVAGRRLEVDIDMSVGEYSVAATRAGTSGNAVASVLLGDLLCDRIDVDTYLTVTGIADADWRWTSANTPQGLRDRSPQTVQLSVSEPDPTTANTPAAATFFQMSFRKAPGSSLTNDTRATFVFGPDRYVVRAVETVALNAGPA